MKRENQLRVKRAVDVSLAFAVLLICLPVLAIAAVAIALETDGPVFFKLRAAGRNCSDFEQWKLRTMVDGARTNGDYFETSANDPRITRVGRFLRRWSIDELPQLWNVLRGDMSLVGPRPTFCEVAAKYSPRQALRLSMRPGITGLAQVNGRNSLTWMERIELDIVYIERYSLRMDCKIVARTIAVIFESEGVYGKDGRVRIPDLG